MYGLLVVVIILLIYFVFSSKFRDPELAPKKVLIDASGDVRGVSDKDYMDVLQDLQEQLNDVIPRVMPSYELIGELERICNKYSIPIRAQNGFVVFEEKGVTKKMRRSDVDPDMKNSGDKRSKMLQIDETGISNLNSADHTNIGYMKFLAELIINHKYTDKVISQADFVPFFNMAKKSAIPIKYTKPTDRGECEPSDLTRIKRVIPHKHPKHVATLYRDLSPGMELTQAAKMLDFRIPHQVRHLALTEY